MATVTSAPHPLRVLTLMEHINKNIANAIVEFQIDSGLFFKLVKA
ncbi:MAG: hypothetical protein ACOX0U_03705 [Oscillospiraceae bacterium]